MCERMHIQSGVVEEFPRDVLTHKLFVVTCIKIFHDETTKS